MQQSSQNKAKENDESRHENFAWVDFTVLISLSFHNELPTGSYVQFFAPLICCFCTENRLAR